MMTQHKKDILPFFVNSFNIFPTSYTATWMLFMKNLFRGISNCSTTFKLILTLGEIIIFDRSFIPVSDCAKDFPVSHISVTAYTRTLASIVYLDPLFQ